MICAGCSVRATEKETVLGPRGRRYHPKCLKCRECSRKLDSECRVGDDGLLRCEACRVSLPRCLSSRARVDTSVDLFYSTEDCFSPSVAGQRQHLTQFHNLLARVFNPLSGKAGLRSVSTVAIICLIHDLQCSVSLRNSTLPISPGAGSSTRGQLQERRAATPRTTICPPTSSPVSTDKTAFAPRD